MCYYGVFGRLLIIESALTEALPYRFFGLVKKM
jgi:hypothetical protein